MQSLGHPSHPKCDRCKRGAGPFMGVCKVLPGFGGGACANCYFNSQAKYCDRHPRTPGPRGHNLKRSHLQAADLDWHEASPDSGPELKERDDSEAAPSQKRIKSEFSEQDTPSTLTGTSNDNLALALNTEEIEDLAKQYAPLAFTAADDSELPLVENTAEIEELAEQYTPRAATGASDNNLTLVETIVEIEELVHEGREFNKRIQMLKSRIPALVEQLGAGKARTPPTPSETGDDNLTLDETIARIETLMEERDSDGTNMRLRALKIQASELLDKIDVDV